MFEENIGQSFSTVRFLTRADDHTVLFESDGVRFLSKSGFVMLSFVGSSPLSRLVAEKPLATKMNYLLTSEGRASMWGSFSSCGPDFIGSSRPQGRLVSRIVQPELIINGANF